MWNLAGKREEAKISTFPLQSTIILYSVIAWGHGFFFPTKTYARDLNASHQVIHVH